MHDEKRAKMPGDEARETPMMLNPCLDDPHQRLEFDDEGLFRGPRVPRARSRSTSMA